MLSMLLTCNCMECLLIVNTLFSLCKDSRGSSSGLDVLLEREKIYKQAIENANKAGDGSKARRYGRGLKVRYCDQSISVNKDSVKYCVEAIVRCIIKQVVLSH